MSNNPVQPTKPEVRLRWTGSRRLGGSSPPPTPPLTSPSVRPRRAAGKGIYGQLILLMMAVAFVLQFHWMQKVRQAGPDRIMPNSFAEKLSRWMLMKRGIPLSDGLTAGQPGVEKINCGACAGTGIRMTEDGEMAPCGICHGVGSRMIRRFSAEDYQCPACAGMGRVHVPESGEIVTCPRCGGRGLILSQPGSDAPGAIPEL